MKIVLLQDVPKIGKKFDIKNVSDGFGRNFLIHKNLAKIVTEDVLKQISEIKAKDKDKKDTKEKSVISAISGVSGKQLVIKVKTNTEGHLFAGLKRSDILLAIKDQFSIDFPQDAIDISKPIKEIGVYKLAVSAFKQKGHLEVKVESL